MDLRPRRGRTFTGFTEAEVKRMEQLLVEPKEKLLEKPFCKRLTRDFNRTSARAGKSVVKWTEVRKWFEKNKQDPINDTSTDAPINDTSMDAPINDTSTDAPIKDTSTDTVINDTSTDADIKDTSTDAAIKDTSTDAAIHDTSTDAANAVSALSLNKAKDHTELPYDKLGNDLSMLEFEAKSSKDGAWYDVEALLSHRFRSSGEIEVCVRYVGLCPEENEWVNAKDSLRERSVALDHSECRKVKVGDLVVCFQEKQDEARYYDARVLEIQRRWHDIRGCRCLFLVRYLHDDSEERVRLRRICCRPEMLV
ncbi:protein SAWADEE HOMEODOMAIN HOMOLOG 1-like [Andrographis paniculata]|uniref:protein SAWADEE HOMEODOMAIN HOMOLOG 1-like n=1 Tax=Andrographis paniculata TaxID=175694 RepID=UPI0021E72A39|nr:protein SAWADEE HOMEODOMAIN HOMOLOG 1-like [Andrographis paniculata]